MIKLQAPLAFAARLMLAFIFIVEGWGKIGYYEGTLQYMENHGVPGLLLPLVEDRVPEDGQLHGADLTVIRVQDPGLHVELLSRDP